MQIRTRHLTALHVDGLRKTPLYDEETRETLLAELLEAYSVEFLVEAVNELAQLLSLSCFRRSQQLADEFEVQDVVEDTYRQLYAAKSKVRGNQLREELDALDKLVGWPDGAPDA